MFLEGIGVHCGTTAQSHRAVSDTTPPPERGTLNPYLVL